MRLKQKVTTRVNIPTASMSDIAFLLLLFFLVSTKFRKEIGFKVLLPEARATERIIKTENLARIYINSKGQISVDDFLVNPEGVTARFKLNTEGWIKATMYVYQKGQLIYKINAKSEIKDKGEMFLFGHWEDVVRYELDRMLQPMIFAVMDSVETFLSRR